MRPPCLQQNVKEDALSKSPCTGLFQKDWCNKVRTGRGKPGKSWHLDVGHGKSWKIIPLSMSERQ